MGRPGCSLCHPSLCFSHSVDGHLSALPRERQWFLLAWVNTQQSNISHVSTEKRPVSGDFAYWSDVVVYIKSDSASVMEQELQQVWFNKEHQSLLQRRLWNFCPPECCWLTVCPAKFEASLKFLLLIGFTHPSILLASAPFKPTRAQGLSQQALGKGRKGPSCLEVLRKSSFYTADNYAVFVQVLAWTEC